MIRIEVKRESSESTASALRRFSKRVQGLGLVKRLKAHKSAERKLSDYKRKKAALKRLARRAEYVRLKKLGKIAATPLARPATHAAPAKVQ